jgi:nicotinate-nucleotide pyrophosphorylase
MPVKNQHALLWILFMNKPTVESVVALALNEDIGTGDVSASLLKDEKVAAIKCHSFRTDDGPRGARYHAEYLIFIHTIAIIQLPFNLNVFI